MERFVFPAIVIPLAAFFTGLGIYARRRIKPMWFWSGSTVREDEIADVPAYNRANGNMWICFSLVFWLAAVLGFFLPGAAGAVLGIGCGAGIPALAIAYQRIYRKYRAR